MSKIVIQFNSIGAMLDESTRDSRIFISCFGYHQDILNGMPRGGLLIHLVARGVQPADFVCHSMFLPADQIPKGTKIKDVVELAKRRTHDPLIKSYVEASFYGLTLPDPKSAKEITWDFLAQEEGAGHEA